MYEYLDMSLDIYYCYKGKDVQPGSVSELELSTNFREVLQWLEKPPTGLGHFFIESVYWIWHYAKRLLKHSIT